PDHRAVVELVRREPADALAAQQHPAGTLIVRALRDARPRLAQRVHVLRGVARAQRPVLRRRDRPVRLRLRHRDRSRLEAVVRAVVAVAVLLEERNLAELRDAALAVLE